MADEWRYFLMTRPIKPRASTGTARLQIAVDPLNQLEVKKNDYFGK